MTPDYLESLRDVVQQAIDEGSLGAPRYLRCVAAVPAGNGLEDAAGGLGDLASAWFGSEPSQRYTLGGAVYVTEMQQWSMGQGAIITVSRSQSTSTLDLMLVGSRGTLYHEE